jgi:hypothetical protein
MHAVGDSERTNFPSLRVFPVRKPHQASMAFLILNDPIQGEVGVGVGFDTGVGVGVG